MAKKFDGVIEAVRYKNGQIEVVRAFERLMQERGYRREESGEESAARVYALVYGVRAEAPTLVAA